MVSRRPAGDTRDVSILYGPGRSLDVRHTVTTWDCGSYTSSRCNNNIDTESASERRGGLNASSNFSAGNISRNRSRAKSSMISREKREEMTASNRDTNVGKYFPRPRPTRDTRKFRTLTTRFEVIIASAVMDSDGNVARSEFHDEVFRLHAMRRIYITTASCGKISEKLYYIHSDLSSLL